MVQADIKHIAEPSSIPGAVDAKYRAEPSSIPGAVVPSPETGFTLTSIVI